MPTKDVNTGKRWPLGAVDGKRAGAGRVALGLPLSRNRPQIGWLAARQGGHGPGRPDFAVHEASGDELRVQPRGSTRRLTSGRGTSRQLADVRSWDNNFESDSGSAARCPLTLDLDRQASDAQRD